MPIDDKYMNIIDQSENRLDDLSDWEVKFIMGEPGKKNKPPLRTRPYLSLGQKQILERIVVERFEGKKWDNNKIRVDYGVVKAERSDEGWKIMLEGYPVGFGVTRKEAVVVTAWLNSALAGILGIPPKELTDAMDGQVAELPEPTEMTETNPGSPEPDAPAYTPAF